MNFMKHFFLVFLAVSLFSFPAFAKEKVTVHVLGMVCEFCAESIFKVFKEKGITDLTISLDDKTVTIIISDGQSLTDEQIKERIYFGGYDLEKIERETL